MADGPGKGIKTPKALAGIEEKWAKLNFGFEKRMQTFEQIVAMLQDGMPLGDTLSLLEERRAARKRPEAAVMGKWARGLAAGKTFSESIKGEVPADELVLISAGERANNLVAGITQAVRVSRSQKQLRSEVIGKAIYPAILFLAVLMILYGFGAKMAPAYIKILPLKDWPASARNLYDLSTFIANYFLYVFGGIVATFTFVGWTLPRWTGPWRNRFDRIPPYSIYKTYVSASFLIALSSLLKAGVPLGEALRHIKGNSTRWMKWHLDRVQFRVRSGMEYGDAMDTGMLDEETTDQVLMYARVSKFDDAIKAIGERSMVAAVAKITTRMKLVQQLAILMVAGTFGWSYGTNMDIQQAITDKSEQQSRKVGR